MLSSRAFNCAPTMIGSVPYTDPGQAWAPVSKYLKELPAWPQLPMRSNLENMYIQYSEGFPGACVQGQKISVVRNGGFDTAVERLFADSEEDGYSGYPVGRNHAAGLHYVADTCKALPLIKGQLTGPVSWGLCVTDDSGRGILYDELLADAVARFLKLKAQWQEAFLKTIARETIVFVDEPYLASLGSAFVSLPGEQVSALISQVLSGIQGLKGLHCCGGTDWSLLLNLPVDIISFDAYNYLDSVLCYENELRAFVKGGKSIAWGIVPNDEETLKNETLSTLSDRLEEAFSRLALDGVSIEQIARQSMITPAYETAVHVLDLLAQLSDNIRLKHGLKSIPDLNS
jgi:hypothetical protein